MKSHNNSKAVTSFLKYSQMISHMGDAIRPQYSYIAPIDKKFEFFMEHIYRAIEEIRSGKPSISEYGDFSFNASLKPSPVKTESFPDSMPTPNEFLDFCSKNEEFCDMFKKYSNQFLKGQDLEEAKVFIEELELLQGKEAVISKEDRDKAFTGVAAIYKTSNSSREFADSIGAIVQSCFKDPSIHKNEIDEFKATVQTEYDRHIHEKVKMGLFAKILDLISSIWGGDVESKFIEQLTTKVQSKEVLGKYTKAILDENVQQANLGHSK